MPPLWTWVGEGVHCFCLPHLDIWLIQYRIRTYVVMGEYNWIWINLISIYTVFHALAIAMAMLPPSIMPRAIMYMNLPRQNCPRVTVLAMLVIPPPYIPAVREPHMQDTPATAVIHTACTQMPVTYYRWMDDAWLDRCIHTLKHTLTHTNKRKAMVFTRHTKWL